MKLKLRDTLRVLYDEAVEFVLIGGAAMQLQGSALKELIGLPDSKKRSGL